MEYLEGEMLAQCLLKHSRRYKWGCSRQSKFPMRQILDILRNLTTPPHRVKKFSFISSGESYAELFDGAKKLLTLDTTVWINRFVLCQ